MHPAILYEITKARTAEMRRLANQDAIARAARRGHRAQIPQRRHLASLACRLVPLLVARGRPITPRPRPRPSCQPPDPSHVCT